MQIIEINLNKIKKDDYNFILESFLLGKVLVMPTDTIYGFSCLANNNKAIEKIKKIKKIKNNRPFIILVSSLNMAKKYCFINRKKSEKIQTLWASNRPTSIILKSRNKLPVSLEERGSLALRLPKSDFLIKLIKSLNVPLISTSFNFTGKELININQAEKIFNKQLFSPDILVKIQKQLKSRPSRLIDLKEDPLIILRK
jgi:L-threonylcarbamoyladenylate synthase